MNLTAAEVWAARPTDTKTCKDCLGTKPLTDFYFNAARDGYNAYCKPCHNDRSQAGRKRNREHAEILEAEHEPLLGAVAVDNRLQCPRCAGPVCDGYQYRYCVMCGYEDYSAPLPLRGVRA